MGDIPPQVVVPDKISIDGSTPSAFQGQSQIHQPPYPAGHATMDYQSTSQPHIPHQRYDDVQFNMAKHQGQAHGGPYNMGAMANALPQPSQRPGQYHPGQHPPTVSSSSMANQLPIQQYGGQPGLGPVANQQYYIQQHPQMTPYYPTPIASSQSYTNMPRPNMGYYPTPVTMSQQAPATYYYAQVGHFPVPAQSLPGQVLPAPYLSSTTPHSDPRFSRTLSVDQTGASTPSQDRGSCKCKQCWEGWRVK